MIASECLTREQRIEMAKSDASFAKKNKRYATNHRHGYAKAMVEIAKRNDDRERFIEDGKRFSLHFSHRKGLRLSPLQLRFLSGVYIKEKDIPKTMSRARDFGLKRGYHYYIRRHNPVILKAEF